MTHFPAVHWITRGENLFDYRPAIGPDGETVIFERTFAAKPHFTQLYTSKIGNPAVSPFLPDTDIQQTRADWYWAGNQVVFNNDALWIVNGDGSDARAIPNTQGFSYPQWNNDGQSITVMNNNDQSAIPKPCSSVINLQGIITGPNINGTDSSNQWLFGGMPAVNPAEQGCIAFAGQPDIDNWVNGKSGYLQEYNYIFINQGAGNGHNISSPMEPGAPVHGYDSAFQGRAPAWSPDGKYIVFESTRKDDSFALFLFNMEKQKVTQLTNTGIQAQHGKFFPCGKKIVFCGKPNNMTRNRIGWIDISDLL